MRINLSLLFIVNFLISLGFAMVDPFFSIYVRDLGATGLHFAAIFSIFTVAKMVLSPWIGFCSDRIGRRNFIAIGLGFYVGVSILYLFPPSITLLIVARFFQGVAAAFFRTISMALVGDQSPKEKEGTNMATFDISFYSALGLGPVFGAIVRTYFGMPGIFKILVAITVVSLLVVPFMIPGGLKNMGGLVRAKTKHAIFRKNKTLIGILSFIFTRAIGISVFTIFLPLFMEKNLGLPGIQIGIIMASGTVLMMLFLKPMGFLADHRSRRALVFIGGLLASALIFFLPFAFGFWSLFCMTIVLGFGSVISLPASAAMVMEEGDYFGMGLVFGLFNTTMNLGFAVAPFLGNFILEYKGLPSVFYCAGIIGVAGILIFYICFMKQPLTPYRRKHINP